MSINTMSTNTMSTNTPYFSAEYFLRLGKFSFFAFMLGAIVLMMGLIHIQANDIITPHRVVAHKTPADFNLMYEDITLKTEDGLNIVGWYIPGTEPNAIILVHGINANRSALLPGAAVLAKAGYPLLMFDLRGHGESEGHQNTYGYREAKDIQAAVDYLLAKPDIKQVGALGTSLGGAAVARAAAIEPRLKAVVVQSSFSSLDQAIEDGFDKMAFLPKWPFGPVLVSLVEYRVGLTVDKVNPSRDLATFSPRPLLIIHGGNDNLFPPYHAQKLYEAAHAPKDLWIVADVGHNIFVPEQEAAYETHILAFFEGAFEE